MTRLRAVDYGAAQALIEVNDSFVTVDINKNDVVSVDTEPTALTAGAWMKVAADFEYPSVWRELAEASVTKLDIEETSEPERERKFRIPDTVKREAEQALRWVSTYSRGESIVGEKLARHLAENNYVTSSDIVRMQRYFSRLSYALTEMAGWNDGAEEFPTTERIRYGMRGGDAGLAWVNKITTKHSIQAAGGFGAPVPGVTDGDKPHTYVEDPDIPGQCEVCGRAADDPIHGVAASAFEYDETCDYFGVGQDPDSTVVSGLMMLRPDGTWARRENDQWLDTEEPAETELLIMLDEDSAYTLASIIDDVLPEDPAALPYELALMNPHEAALFYAAEPEIDWTLVDRVFDIYDSTERSVNAKRQVRGPGGKFGDEPDAPDAEKETVAETKARLPQALPLVPDVAARIAQYLAEVGAPQEAPAPEAAGEDPAAPVQASGELSTDYLNSLIELAEADPAAAPVAGGDAEAAPAAAPAGPRPLYLAIVDAVDTEAVLDVVSLMPGPPPIMWKRDAGQWVQAPEILAALQGTAPPPVVELTDDAIVKNVLEQVDQATTGGEEPAEEEVPGASPQNPDGAPVTAKPDANPDQHPVAAAGLVPPTLPPIRRNPRYALPDGSFAVDCVWDLKQALANFSSAKNPALTQQHLVRRARAFGRMDLIPSEWKTLPVSEEFSLWGPYGELMKLTEFEGGADRNRGGAEKLRHYWTRGEGGLKVGWNTPGDMTRCMKFLAKYLRGREAGYCALRHKEMTGMWPGDKRNPGMEK